MTTKVSIENRHGSIVEAALWMTLLGVLLAWLPVFGAFIAGLVGGRKAGGLPEALLAYFVPALVLSAILLAWGMFGSLPIGRAISSSRQVTVLVATNLPLLAGAALGAAWED